MGDEDKDLDIVDYDEEIEEWLNGDYSSSYEFGSFTTDGKYVSHSDMETWLIEKSIEAKSQYPNQRTQARRELYLLKCKIERIYNALPVEPTLERDWDKEEVHRILKDGK